ncbi:MAG: Gfo/Idh/MocA family oxidoreductase [Kiritimatiellae bacterium]|nr:Gfo/Idh/MocA family oxidoreductase [Kiritimatiellia bacterium]
MNVSRRNFLLGGSCAAFPYLIPGTAWGANPPSEKIQVGVIGCGRIACSMDVPGIAQNSDLAVVTAVSDCDRIRAGYLKARAEAAFGTKVKTYARYRDLLADPSIDAVLICTPDFSHAEIAVAAALAGKDIYVQKPLAMSISEGRAIVETFARTGRIFHIGSQQRSEGRGTFGPVFRKAVEYVRDGRLGQIRSVEIGLPSDPSEPGDLPLRQPVPETFDWDAWQGRTPFADYCELRSHPQGKDGAPNILSRPGWMTMQCYDLGMIANWGAHHLDIAQWALNAGESGPVRVEGTAEYPKRRLWDVHGKLRVSLSYAGGTEVKIAGTDCYPNGVRFIGDNGWIFCSRTSQKALIPDPGAGGKHGRWRPLEASARNLIEGEVARPVARNASNHHRVWLESIKSRKPTNITPEEAHRSTSACILAYTAMKLGRPLTWNPSSERFAGDDDANRTLVLEERAPYGVLRLLKQQPR